MTLAGNAALPLAGYPLSENGLGPDLEFIRTYLEDKYGVTASVGECKAESGHVAGSFHYTGHACDWEMGTYGVKALGSDKALGDAIAADLVANAEILNVEEVIWYGEIWTERRADEGWRHYTNSNGSGIVLDHYDHLHVSANRDR